MSLLRAAIIAGLNDAHDEGLLTEHSVAVHRADGTLIALIADRVEAALQARIANVAWQSPQGPDTAEPESLDCPVVPVEPVATVDAIEILPMLAAAAHRLSPEVPDLDADQSTMGVEVLTGIANPRAFKQFLFHIQPMFGVRTRVQVIDGDVQFTVGGIRDDVRAFRLIVETFATLDQDTFTGLDPADQAALWSTIGHMASTTPRALEQSMEAGVRYNTATAYLRERLGPARVLNRVEPVTDGAVRDLAVTALADAATRLR